MTANPAEPFIEWMCRAKPGERHEYHRGFFGANPDAHPYRDAIIAAYLTGQFELTQQRHGENDYSYYITRRKSKDTGYREWHRDNSGFIRRAILRLGYRVSEACDEP